MRQNPHVRICGGPGSATTLVYPTSNHPGDKRLLGQTGDGVDPRGAVAAVATAQAEREFGHAHVGMGGVGGSAPRRGPPVSDDRRCRMSRRTSMHRRRSHPAASY